MERQEKRALAGLTLKQLKIAVGDLGMPSYAASQIADWIYRKGAVDIDAMTNISLKFRTLLSEHYTVGLVPPSESVSSRDGTKKYLFQVSDGRFVEAVYIPDADRATLCISSQVGCKMGCVFCMTGRQHYTANLTADEIMNQILSLPERETLTNVVFMGMGEPLDNLDNVLAATEIMTADWGMRWSPRRITVSTVGVRRGLRRIAEESECHLAVSLHAPSPEKRAQIVPAEKAFSMTEMLEVLRRYDFSHQRRLSFEYTLFGGFNDSQADARELVRVLHGIPCRVNLIRFHEIPDSTLRRSDEQTVTAFRDYLTGHGVFATVRASRGEDVWAACGMLSTAASDSVEYSGTEDNSNT